MRRVLLALLLTALFAPATARAEAPYVINGFSPGWNAADQPDMSTLGPIAKWQGKRTGVVNVFGGAPELRAYFDTIWASGSVPMLSYYPSTPNSATAAGVFDGELQALVLAFRAFVVGPDGQLHTADDRRAYLRYASEPNFKGYAYSPCSKAVNGGGAPADYVNAWRRAHGIFRAGGLGSAHVAWMYVVTTGDSCAAGSIERTYPGPEYVDWIGLNAYDVCGGVSGGAAFKGPSERVRRVDASKPLAVSEVGVSSYLSADYKNAWIRDFYYAARTLDFRMVVWFNIELDVKRDCAAFEKPWAVFGPDWGDETVPVGDRTFKAFSGYRQSMAHPWIVGTDPANPRLLTDDLFLGRGAPVDTTTATGTTGATSRGTTAGATGSTSGAVSTAPARRRRAASGVRSALPRGARRYRPAKRRAR